MSVKFVKKIQFLKEENKQLVGQMQASDKTYKQSFFHFPYRALVVIIAVFSMYFILDFVFIGSYRFFLQQTVWSFLS